MNYAQAIDEAIAKATRAVLAPPLSRVATAPPEPICEWLEANVPGPDGTPFRLEPYQRLPIEFLDRPGDRELTVAAPEQVGKSEIWRRYLFAMLAREPSDTWITYESDRKAEDVNRTTIIPTLRQIPALAGVVDRPGVIRRDAFYLPGATIHFSGSGAPVTTHAKRVVIADEVDFWTGLTNDSAQDKQSNKAARNVDNLTNLRKRTRTYRGRRRIIQVSSPTLRSGPIWRAFSRGSRSYWCLACLQCGERIRSCDTWLLQFERDQDGEPVPGSIRLVCPSCKHEHSESDARAMNTHPNAGYDHTEPSRLEGDAAHLSVQFGALACPRAISWHEIAEAIVDGGASASLEGQKVLDNSYRGLPLQERKDRPEASSVAVSHCRPLPDASELRAVLFSADTQDDGWYCVHRAIDDAGNLYGLRSAFAPDLETLEVEWSWRYQGMQAIAGIIDEGGHRAKMDVVPFVLSHAGLYTYKGETAVRELSGWKISDAKDRRRRLILANPYHFQEQLLWLMYQHTDPNAQGFWCLPPQTSETEIAGMHPEYLPQLTAMARNSRKKFGHEYRNWDSGGAPDHFFDAEKMLLVLLEYSLKVLPPRVWRGGRLPHFYVERLRKESARRRARQP